jgi:1-acyl-sn-glycerol-3-phosphate acyltransferase
VTALRSALFLVWFLAISIVLHLVLLPFLLGPRQLPLRAARLWSRMTLFGLKWINGLDYEIRGAAHIPRGPALVAAKHFSIWDTIALTVLLKDPAFVVKRELADIPFYGWYLRKADMIPIDRDAGPSAIRALRGAARRAAEQQRQIVIFPEGTRRRPGDPPAYKPGVAALYGQLDLPCIPVAHNAGLYWTGFGKRPGTIVMEFLPAIPPRLQRARFMAELETRTETATNRLLDEGRARFTPHA